MSENANDQNPPPQDGTTTYNTNNTQDELSSKLSYDDTSASKFVSSIDDISHSIPPDTDDQYYQEDITTMKNTTTTSTSPRSPKMSKDDYNDDVFAMHSIPHPDELPRTNSKKTTRSSRSKAMQTFAGVAGNVLEWYDFAVFGFFSDIIGKTFFPPQEGDADILESFTVFGLAFLARPVGGALLGYIGDTHGRKRALEISIFLMAFPTFAMGCLPSYERVGPLAIVLLVFVRCLQGLSVGGQLVSSLVFTVEQNPRNQWGLYGSYVMAAANFGTLLGGLISTALRASLTEEQLLTFGWRIPFLSGVLVSLCGLYLKYYGEEDAIDHAHGGGGGEKLNGNPLILAFRKENLRSLAAASLVPMLWSGGFYISFVWMATFMEVLIDQPVPNAFLVNSSALFVSVCLLFPLAGILSDIFGRSRVMYMGGASLVILSPIMVNAISQGSAIAAFFAQCALGIALSLWGAPMCAWLVESFPPAIRLTSVAVGYNIAQAIIGGSSPAIATYLVDTHGLQSPGYFISVIAIFALIGLTIGGGIKQDDIVLELPEKRTRSNSRDNLFDYDSDGSDQKTDSAKLSQMELI